VKIQGNYIIMANFPVYVEFLGFSLGVGGDVINSLRSAFDIQFSLLKYFFISPRFIDNVFCIMNFLWEIALRNYVWDIIKDMKVRCGKMSRKNDRKF
jgi:hypothetical protein